MEVLNHLRASFRGRSVTARVPQSQTSSSGASSDGSSSSLNSSTDSNNNSSNSKKRTRQHSCNLCGKRLLKLAGWRNYFTLPCRCRHVFCKQCITGRLQCRQKVLRSASFSLMWTFLCPGSSQCRQQLSVDFSRGSSYSKNLVARDIDTSGDEEENFWGHRLHNDDDDDDDKYDDGSYSVPYVGDASVCCEDDDDEGQDQDASQLREIG